MAEMTEDQKAVLADAIGEKQNHCPFGCTLDQLDEYGYCEHLLGFTNDGVSYEPIVPEVLRDGSHTGRKMVVGGKGGKLRKSVPKDRTLVNPQEVQMVNGLRTMAKKWVSSRVYREKGPVIEEQPVVQTAKK